MKKFLAVVLALLVTGCCCAPGNSPEYITYNLNRGFLGRPANYFFSNFGFPVAVFDHADGNKEYVWSSAGQTKKPAAASVNASYANEGTFQFVNNYHGVIQRQYCELRIYTDPSENVTGFVIAVDSVGEWSTSRCSEIFDKTYP